MDLGISYYWCYYSRKRLIAPRRLPKWITEGTIPLLAFAYGFINNGIIGVMWRKEEEVTGCQTTPAPIGVVVGISRVGRDQWIPSEPHSRHECHAWISSSSF